MPLPEQTEVNDVTNSMSVDYSVGAASRIELDDD